MKGVFEDKPTLSTAVSDWVANEATAEETHGAISGWDTSRVDDMSELFKDKTGFNAQLNWDTSKVTMMYGTFFEEAGAALCVARSCSSEEGGGTSWCSSSTRTRAPEGRGRS